MFIHNALGHRGRLPPGLLLAAGIVAMLAAAPSYAATWTWDGGGGNDNWTNGMNWVGDVSPANNGTADIVFAGTTRLTPNLSVDWSINSLTFSNVEGVFNLKTSNGSTLIIGAGGITNNDNNIQGVNHTLALAALQTWNAASGSVAISSGTVLNNGHLLTINAEMEQSVTFFVGAIHGGGGLTKNGLGHLSMLQSPANTYSGTTTINGGSVHLAGDDNVAAMAGSLNIGDGVGTAIDVVTQFAADKIPDAASVSVFSTGTWIMEDAPPTTASETIKNLNIESAGIAGGGLVVIGGGTLTVLGNLTMSGGAVKTSGAGSLALNGSLITNAASATASISSQLDLGGEGRIFTIAEGAVPIDLNVTGVVSNGAIHMDGPGALRLGAANTYAGGTTLNAGTILIGHDLALSAGLVTGNGGTLQAEGAPRTLANSLTGSITVAGSLDLTLNSALNPNSAITKNGPGTLIFARAGAVWNALTVNAGAVRLDAPATFSDGLINSATLSAGAQTLTVNGAGFNNQGSLPLSGGTLAGNGPVVNNSLVSGSGTIGGTGGFTNNAQLTLSGGNLTLAKTGSNANAGQVNVGPGLQLRLTGSSLTNTGAVDLAGGVIAGTSTLSNIVGGIVSGHGLISAPLANAGGTLRAVGGTLNVTSAFTSSGVIRLDDAAGLTGGAITNTGLIHGDGAIANALSNAAGGSIRVDAGKTLLINGAFAANVGEINLQGGALDFAGAITNSAAGFIAGRGALYTGGLTNNGQMAFSGGATDVHGDVTLTVGARVVTSGTGSVTTFFDDVVHNGLAIFTGANASTVFFGNQSGAGSFTGTGTVYYIGDLRPGNSAAAVSYGGSVLLGSATTLTVELGGVAAGTQYDQLRVTGDLSLGGDLTVSLISGFSPSAGQLFNILDWGSLNGSFSALNLPSLGGGLVWNASQLYTSGVLSVTPGFTADFDEDGDVDAADLVNWRAGFGVNGAATHTQGDADGDLDVDGADFLTWQRQLNAPPSASIQTAAAPEPSAVVLVAVAATTIALPRRLTSTRQKESKVP